MVLFHLNDIPLTKEDAIIQLIFSYFYVIIKRLIGDLFEHLSREVRVKTTISASNFYR